MGDLRDWDFGFGLSLREGGELAALRDSVFGLGETSGVESWDGLLGAFLSFAFGESFDAGCAVDAVGDFFGWAFGFGESSGVGEADGEPAGLMDLVLRLGEVMIGMGRSTSSRTLARPIS